MIDMDEFADRETIETVFVDSVDDSLIDELGVTPVIDERDAVDTMNTYGLVPNNLYPAARAYLDASLSIGALDLRRDDIREELKALHAKKREYAEDLEYTVHSDRAREIDRLTDAIKDGKEEHDKIEIRLKKAVDDIFTYGKQLDEAGIDPDVLRYEDL